MTQSSAVASGSLVELSGTTKGMADLGHRLKSSAMSNSPGPGQAPSASHAERPLRALWSHRASYRVSAR